MKIKFIFLLLSLFNFSIAQNKKTTYTYVDANLSKYELLIDQNRFIIRNQISNIESDAIYVETYASGSVEYKASDIFLKLSDAKYDLKIIDKDKVLNIDLPLLAKDTLYAIIRESNNMRITGNWKNRKKDGTWRYVNFKNGKFILEKEEIYKEGKLIKTIIPDKNKSSPYI